VVRRRTVLHSADAKALGDGRYRFALSSRAVVSAELIRASLPRPHAIHPGNASFGWNDATFTLPQGDYTSAQLASTLEAIVRSQTPSARVTVAPHCGRLGFAAAEPFHLVLGAGSPRYELGFEDSVEHEEHGWQYCAKQSAPGLYELLGSRRVDLSGSRFACLEIEELRDEHGRQSLAVPFASANLSVFDNSTCAARAFRPRDLPRIVLRIVHRGGSGQRFPYDLGGLAWHVELQLDLQGTWRNGC